MGEINIEVGMTKELRLIGIQPPLTDVQRQTLIDAEFMDGDLSPRFGMLPRPDGTGHYSYQKIEVTEFITSEEATERALSTAEKIATLFRRNGDTVTVDSTLRDFAKGELLFDNTQLRTQPPENVAVITTPYEFSQNGLEQVIDATTKKVSFLLKPKSGADDERPISEKIHLQDLVKEVARTCEVLDKIVPITGGSWFESIHDRAEATAADISTPQQ